VIGNLRAKLNRWQWAVLFAVLILSIFLSFQLVDSGSGETAVGNLDATERLVSAQKGDLVNSVSFTGSLIYPDKYQVTLGSSGTADEIYVRAADLVSEGDTLLQLDTETVANRVELLSAAKIKLREAQDSLDQLIYKSQKDVNEASINLSNAEFNLISLQKQWNKTVDNNQTTLTQSRDGYVSSLVGWIGIKPKDYNDSIEKMIAPSILFDSLSIDLFLLFDGTLSTDIAYAQYAHQAPLDDPATAWDETLLWGWKNFHPERIIGKCDSIETPLGARCVNNEIDNAWTAYSNANNDLIKNEALAGKALSTAELLIDKETEKLGVTNEFLADVLKGSDSLELSLKHAEVSSAEILVQTLEEQLTIVAPFSGIVSRVNIEAGQPFGAIATAIEILDPNTIELEGQIDEIDVLYISIGAEATVLMDALPDTEIYGVVSHISPVSQTKNGLVTYTVNVQIDPPQNVTLLEGMSATASIVTREYENVLLIPVKAVQGSYSQPFVRVMNENGTPQNKYIKIGPGDEFVVIVEEGLIDGEEVIVEFTAEEEIDLNNQLRSVSRASSGGSQRPTGPPGGRN
jgi:RND family efflux transporter MFP subunit